MNDHERSGIDSVTLSVINNAYVNICREMGTAMMRTSYSPIFNEGQDFSCMIPRSRPPPLPGRARPSRHAAPHRRHPA
jgi:Hydantoinase B/oxoprolinase